MSVDLSTFPTELVNFVHGQINSGKFGSEDEVVRTALILMKEQEQTPKPRERETDAEELDAEMDEYTPEEQAALEEIARITPSNEELLRLAATNPPPPEWFQGDEERPW